ncbi:MAG: copper chaperone PCu(A)C [Pseudomonadota bacterium]
MLNSIRVVSAALFVSLFLFTTPTAKAHVTITIGDIALTDMWTRATPPAAKAGGGYVIINNTGDTDDRLIAIETDAAPVSQIHEMSMTDGVMKMRELADGLVIPAGEAVQLKPGGYHLMFMGLTQGLKEGSEITVTLTFERAGAVDIVLPVAPIGATQMPEHSHN